MKKRDYSFITNRGGREHNVTGVTNKPTQSLEEKIYDLLDPFLEKWTGKSYAHLADTDENDGQRLRNDLLSLFSQEQKRLIESIPDKTTRGYLDSSDEWLDGYKEGRKDVKAEALNKLERENQ